MTDEDPIDLAPFDMLTQKEQWAHLVRYHSPRRLDHYATSKSRKAAFEQMHSRSHLQGVFITTPHTHTAVADLADPPADEISGSDLSGSDLSKPLNVTQRRALKDLVENDFLAMKAEIQQMADDMAKQRRAEITAEWAARGADADAFEVKGQKIIDTYKDACANLIQEARAAGVELKMPDVRESYNPKLEASVNGLQEKLREAEAEIDADRRRALNTLERSRLTAQRRVLLTGVTQEALAVLDTIPTAQALMLEAAAQRTGRTEVTA